MKIKNLISASTLVSMMLIGLNANANNITADAARSAATNFLSRHTAGTLRAPATGDPCRGLHGEP